MEIMNQEQSLFNEISTLIEQSQRNIYALASSATVLLFWRLGQRVNRKILQNKGNYPFNFY